jgi:Tfp pilus assembly protein FimT
MRDKTSLPDPNGRPQAVDAGFCILEMLATVAAAAVVCLMMLAGFPVRMAGATRSTRLKAQEHQREAAEAVKAVAFEDRVERR